MFRATIGYLISVQFRYIPIIFALILIIPLSMVDFSVEISFFFTLVLLLGLFCITYHKGFLLNTKINEYQIYTGFWGLKFGSWQPLPEVSQIYVSRGGAGFNSTIGLINYGNVSATAVFVVLHTQDGKKKLALEAKLPH